MHFTIRYSHGWELLSQTKMNPALSPWIGKPLIKWQNHSQQHSFSTYTRVPVMKACHTRGQASSASRPWLDLFPLCPRNPILDLHSLAEAMLLPLVILWLLFSIRILLRMCTQSCSHYRIPSAICSLWSGSKHSPFYFHCARSITLRV